jgi:hypothetical protein
MNQSVYICRAIHNLRPGAEFRFDDADYSTIEWVVLDGKAPTQAEIDAEIEAIKAKDIQDEEARQQRKAAVLARLGLTEDEAKLLLS